MPSICRFEEGALRSDGGLHLPLARAHYVCRDGELELLILCLDDQPVPPAVFDEPLIGCLARLRHWSRASGALPILRRPAQSLGPARLPGSGLRAIMLDDPADEACWDAALAEGQVLYALCGELLVDHLQNDARSLLAAITFGNFQCGDSIPGLTWNEGVDHCAWRLPAGAAIELIARGGYPVLTSAEPSGRWHDSGQEGSVRAVIRQGERRLFTQPRMIAPRSQTMRERGC